MKILYVMAACVAVSTEENIGKIFGIFLELLGTLGNCYVHYSYLYYLYGKYENNRNSEVLLIPV